MKNRKCVGIACLIGILGLLAACQRGPLPEAGSASEILTPGQAARCRGKKILTALQQRNYEDLKRCLEQGPLAAMTRAEFCASEGAMRQRFGVMTEICFLTELETPLVRNLIWKVRFERRNPENRLISQELLFRLVTGTLDGKTVVLNMGFF